ncbi:MAG TPA: hypothetical protein VK274_00305, partial [Pyrinomonadaceae bacterium]|nr:hypothetical protein [Pyrinomonadaceae bacterium]
MGLFWRRKKDEFVSLRLNEPAPATVEEKQAPGPAPTPIAPVPPLIPTPIEAKAEAAPPPAEAPAATVREKPVPSRSPFQTSVLGLDRSIE